MGGGGERDHRIAAERNGVGHFRGAGFQHFREAVGNLPAVIGIPRSPAGADLGGGFHGVAQILAAAERDVREEGAGGVIHRCDPSILGADESSAEVALGGDWKAQHREIFSA